MLSIAKEKAGNGLLVRLTGPVEENVNFEALIGGVTGELTINCKGVPRINSVGVKAWIKYFQGLASKGVKITFSECSIAIVEQMNLISNFTCGGTVESIFVPFACSSCKGELVGLFKVTALKSSGFKLPSLKCSKCGGNAVFDDIPEEYFNFLMG